MSCEIISLLSLCERKQHLRLGLRSLTAMRYTVASLRCVPQSMQGVHRVIQSLFLFDVVSGYVKRHPFPGLSLRVRLAAALFVHVVEK
jgi:hypothetical protein